MSDNPTFEPHASKWRVEYDWYSLGRTEVRDELCDSEEEAEEHAEFLRSISAQYSNVKVVGPKT
jgi:hypothetical protein